MTDVQVAYVTSYYPGISHTFILREVTALRALGARVVTTSVRAPAPGDLLARADREEAARTTVLLDRRRLLRAHLATLATAPGAYAGALRSALRRGAGARGRVWQLFYWAEAVVLAHLCRAAGIRHLHAHFANNAADVARIAADLGSAAGWGGRWTWSFTMHGPTEFAEVSRYGLPGKVRDADLVVCISDFARSQLMALVEEPDWDKLRVVHCGVDSAAFAPAPPDGEPGPGGRPLRVLNVGRLVPEKGQSVLVQAVARLHDVGVAVEAVVIGGGDRRAVLEAQAAAAGVGDRVRFLGAVGQDDIRQWYAWADVFCMPSFAEGVPVVLMEAMASGLPVVTTRIAGVAELVEDGVSGRLVAPGRADLVAAALAELAGDPELRLTAGAAGRERVQRDFDSRREAGRLLASFGGLESARSAGAGRARAGVTAPR